MKNKKGFTLVELLIVIVVIGVLSAMMMLSSTEAVSSARAASIINDMRVLKTAVLEWYADNHERVGKFGDEYYIYTDITKKGKSKGKFLGEYIETKEGKADIEKYLGNSGANLLGDPHSGLNKLFGSYFLTSETRGEVSKAVSEGTAEKQKHTGCSWYVGYRFRTNEDKVKEKLQARATSLGLIGGSIKNVSDTYEAPGEYIYMLIQDL